MGTMTIRCTVRNTMVNGQQTGSAEITFGVLGKCTFDLIYFMQTSGTLLLSMSSHFTCYGNTCIKSSHQYLHFIFLQALSN